MDQQNLQQALQQHAQLEVDRSLDQLAAQAPIMLWLARADGLVTYVNSQWLHFTGKTLESQLGTGWLSGVYPEDLDSVIDRCNQSVQAGEMSELYFRLQRYDGEYIWIKHYMQPRYNEQGEFIGFIAVTQSAQELYLLKDQLNHLQMERQYWQQHDALTSTFSRQYLFRQADKLLKTCGVSACPLFLLMLNVDGWQHINHCFGYQIGDKLLLELVNTIAPCLRNKDSLCHFSADTFCVLLPDVDRTRAGQLADRIRREAKVLTLTEQPALSITLSLGLAQGSYQFGHVDDWLVEAEAALEQAKQQGGDQVVIADL